MSTAWSARNTSAALSANHRSEENTLPVNLDVWNATLKQVRLRLQEAERHELALALEIGDHNRKVNALRKELQHLEQIDKDLSDLINARRLARA